MAQHFIPPLAATPEDLAAHEARTDNPHAVTKAQVGLGQVDNTADADKPISIAMQTALARKADTDEDGRISRASLSPRFAQTVDLAQSKPTPAGVITPVISLNLPKSGSYLLSYALRSHIGGKGIAWHVVSVTDDVGQAISGSTQIVNFSSVHPGNSQQTGTSVFIYQAPSAGQLVLQSLFQVHGGSTASGQALADANGGCSLTAIEI